MAGPFGVSPGVPGNYAYRAAPAGTIQSRPLPVPLVTPTTIPQAGIVTGGVRPMPGATLQTPSALTGFTPTRPTVLVPGSQPTSPVGTIGGRPLPTTPITPVTPTSPTYPGTTYPNGRPTPTQPQIGQYPSRTSPTPTTPGSCGIPTNWGLIGFFDKTVGAAVKRLLGMRDACVATGTNGMVTNGLTTNGLNTNGLTTNGLTNGTTPYSMPMNGMTYGAPTGLQLSPRRF